AAGAAAHDLPRWLSRPGLRQVTDRTHDVQAADPPRSDEDRDPRQRGPGDERRDDRRRIEMERDNDLSVGDDLVEEIHHDVPEAEAREGAERRGDDRVE